MWTSARVALPAPRRAVLQTLLFPALHNNLFAYRLTISGGPRGEGEGACAVPAVVVRSHAPALAEDKFFAHECLNGTWSLPLTFHGFNTPRGAVKNSLLRPIAKVEALTVQLFTDPMAPHEVRTLCNQAAWACARRAHHARQRLRPHLGGTGDARARRGRHGGPGDPPVRHCRHRVSVWASPAGSGDATARVGSHRCGMRTETPPDGSGRER